MMTDITINVCIYVRHTKPKKNVSSNISQLSEVAEYEVSNVNDKEKKNFIRFEGDWANNTHSFICFRTWINIKVQLSSVSLPFIWFLFHRKKKNNTFAQLEFQLIQTIKKICGNQHVCNSCLPLVLSHPVHLLTVHHLKSTKSIQIRTV